MSALLKVLVSLGADTFVNSAGQLPCCLFLLLCTSVDDKPAAVTRNNAWIYAHQSVYKYRGGLAVTAVNCSHIGLIFQSQFMYRRIP